MTTPLTPAERAACATVERLLREQMPSWTNATKLELTSAGVVVNAIEGAREQLQYGRTLADAIERARAARKPAEPTHGDLIDDVIVACGPADEVIAAGTEEACMAAGRLLLEET